MALFGRKKEKKEEEKEEIRPSAKELPAKKSSASVPVLAHEGELSTVIKNPRITEKASDLGAESVYVFDTTPEANKKTVALAVQAIYNVVPRKVRIAQVPSKARYVRGKWGRKSGGKKAYVYLKKGETIEVM